MNLKPSAFGTEETHDSIKRIIYWMKVKNFLLDRYNFNPRMNNQGIKKYITEFYEKI